MFTQLVVVRSKTEEDAVVRLQSDAVVRGLKQSGPIPASTVAPDKVLDHGTIVAGACVLFHYDDTVASAAVRALVQSDTPPTIGCFASDIYSFDQYLAVHDIVDFYMAPTRLHKLVLQSQLYKPVYLLPESIDPSSGTGAIGNTPFPEKSRSRIVWFGYPESFEKGMVSLIPILNSLEAQKAIESFTLILGTQKFENRFALSTVPYDRGSFAKIAGSFDYCLLSHLPLDLAVNSYIKSPNKLVTALVLGLIPFASRTPAYEDLLTEFGLHRFLFDSPSDLHRKLSQLDPRADSALIRQSGILEELKRRYSDTQIAAEFCLIFSSVDQRDRTLDLTDVTGDPEFQDP